MSNYTKVIKLIMVSELNNNKFYDLYDHGDGTMHVEYGRVQKTSVSKSYSISEWDSIYRSKTKKGYQDVTHLHKETIEGNGLETTVTKKIVRKEIDNPIINKIFSRLQQYANVVVQEKYTVTSEAVTQAMVDEAQEVINDISGSLKINVDHKELNKKLLKLFTIIPRQMNKVQYHLFTAITNQKELEEASKKISSEQDTLDTMAGQVLANTKKKKAIQVAQEKHEDYKDVTILEELGLLIEETNADENEQIKKALGDMKNNFKKAYKVVNIETQNKYENHTSKYDNVPKREELFWHGSRNQNWYFILQKGLLIRPKNSIYSGSMWGDAVYFANKAKKSAGYSSFRGSYWAKGNDDSGFLAIYAVNVGKQWHWTKHNSDAYKLSKKMLDDNKYDSVYAHGGADLINDEFTIYEPEKCTIKYLVEIS